MSHSISRANSASSPNPVAHGDANRAAPRSPRAAATEDLYVSPRDRVEIGDAPFAPYGANNGMGGGWSSSMVDGLVVKMRRALRVFVGSGR